jgi:hypothetical protein
MRKKLNTPSTKTKEPSMLDELSGPLRAFVRHFQDHSIEAIEQLRLKNPEKYIELSTRLVALIATLKPEPDGFKQCKTMEEVGIKLLQSVKCPEDLITGAMVEDAIKANDTLVEQLIAIRDAAQGPMQ